MSTGTVAPDHVSGDAEASTERRFGLRHHLVGLTLVLLALMPLLGTDRIFSADEAAVAAQADLLDGRGAWELPHPLPEVDPDGTAFPLHNSLITADGGVPFAKHPIYPLVLAPLYGLGGVAAMKLLSLAGTVAAAGVGALLARRLRPGLDGPVVWAIGLASPLFLYGYVLIAHTLGAAAAGLAVVGVLDMMDGRARRGALLAAGGAIGLALLRTEGLLFLAALVVTVMVIGLARRQRSALVAGAWVGVASAGGLVLSRIARTVPGVAAEELATPANGTGATGNLLADRIQGAEISLILPRYGPLTPTDLALLLGVVLLTASLWLARRRPEDRDGIRLVASAGVVLVAIRLLGEPTVVPGLLLAFPLLTAGLLGAGRPPQPSVPARLMAVTMTLFALAVLATQYATAGSGEWGGRYFALALPVATALAIAGIARVVDGLDHRTGRALVGALGAASLILSLHAARSLWNHQHSGADSVAFLSDYVADVADPVVVATDGVPGRFGWRTVVAGAPWLLIEEPEGLTERADALAGLDRPIVLVTADEVESLEALGDRFTVADRRSDLGELDGRDLLTLTPG